MTLATTCPRCKTSFKVVSDQLKLRRGMVRCGVCQNVFNGLEHLKYVEPSPGARQAMKPKPVQVTEEIKSESPQAAAALPNLEHWPNVINKSAATDSATNAALESGSIVPSAVPTTAVPTSREPTSIEKAFNAFSKPPTPAPAPQEWPLSPVVVPAAVSVPQKNKNNPAPAPEPSRGVAQNTTTLIRQDNDLQTAFFLPDRFEAEELARSIVPPRSITMPEDPSLQAKRPDRSDPSDEAIDFFSSEKSHGTTTQRASKTGMRITWIVLSILALLQVIFLLRNVIAQRFPSARYTIETMSNAVGLKVTLPSNLTVLTIESFDVQATGRPDILAISAIVRNRAAHPIRWPAMELTLTGVDGKPVLRKIIAPNDYLAAYMINNGATAQTEHPIRFGLQTNSLAPTGYSVNLFYLN
jgi:predicted Zn finger-like uncharacterized protein